MTTRNKLRDWDPDHDQWDDPTAKWRKNPATARQLRRLEFFDVKPGDRFHLTAGEASEIIDSLEPTTEALEDYRAWKAAGEPNIRQWKSRGRDTTSTSATNGRKIRAGTVKVVANQIQAHCPTCGQPRLFERQGLNNILHLFLSVFTCGVWLIVWFFLAIGSAGNAYRCTVCGHANRKPSWRSLLILAALCGLVYQVWHAGMAPSPSANPGPHPSAASATEPTPNSAKASQAAALKRYPQLGVPGSPINKEFLRLHDEAQAHNPALLSQPDWPEQLAARAAAAASN